MSARTCSMFLRRLNTKFHDISRPVEKSEVSIIPVLKKSSELTGVRDRIIIIRRSDNGSLIIRSLHYLQSRIISVIVILWRDVRLEVFIPIIWIIFIISKIQRPRRNRRRISRPTTAAAERHNKSIRLTPTLP